MSPSKTTAFAPKNAFGLSQELIDEIFALAFPHDNALRLMFKYE